MLSGALGSVTLVALTLMKRDPEVDYKPQWTLMPSGYVRAGVGLHMHERPIPTGAFDFDLGPEWDYDEIVTLRPALAYGLDVSGARPVEQFGALGLGFGLHLQHLVGFEYMPAVQLGGYRGEFEPAFRHTLTLHVFHYLGLAFAHYVTDRDPELGRPRQVLRIMFGVDVARLVAYQVM